MILMVGRCDYLFSAEVGQNWHYHKTAAPVNTPRYHLVKLATDPHGRSSDTM